MEQSHRAVSLYWKGITRARKLILLMLLILRGFAALLPPCHKEERSRFSGESRLWDVRERVGQRPREATRELIEEKSFNFHCCLRWQELTGADSGRTNLTSCHNHKTPWQITRLLPTGEMVTLQNRTTIISPLPHTEVLYKRRCG